MHATAVISWALANNLYRSQPLRWKYREHRQITPCPPEKIIRRFLGNEKTIALCNEY